MWKNLRNRVVGDRGSAKSNNSRQAAKTEPKTLAGVVTMATNTNNEPKKAKTSKSKKHKESPEDKEMKEVLHLFNHLEELILDGDPRVREILEHK